jgi:hypothetical protein
MTAKETISACVRSAALLSARPTPPSWTCRLKYAGPSILSESGLAREAVGALRPTHLGPLRGQMSPQLSTPSRLTPGARQSVEHRDHHPGRRRTGRELPRIRSRELAPRKIMKTNTLLHVSNRRWNATAAAAIRTVLVIMIPHLMRRAPRCPAKNHSAEVTGNATNTEQKQESTVCTYAATG